MAKVRHPCIYIVWRSRRTNDCELTFGPRSQDQLSVLWDALTRMGRQWSRFAKTNRQTMLVYIAHTETLAW